MSKLAKGEFYRNVILKHGGIGKGFIVCADICVKVKNTGKSVYDDSMSSNYIREEKHLFENSKKDEAIALFEEMGSKSETSSYDNFFINE